MSWFGSSLRKSESFGDPSPAAPNHVPAHCLSAAPATTAPPSRPRRRAARPAPIFRLYQEPPRPAAVQANALLELVREQCPEASGHWLIVEDLSRAYGELAEREGWRPLHWAQIGRELAKLTRRRTVKRAGKRHVAYLLR